VVESLRAGVPSAVLYVGARVQHDERISEAIKLAADRGVAVLEAGPAELDRLTGGALHQGLALRVRPYDYAHPDDLLARAADAGQLPLIAALDGVTDRATWGRWRARRPRSAPTGWWSRAAAAPASRRAPGRRPRAHWPGASGPRGQPGPALQSYRDAGVFVAGLDAAGDTGSATWSWPRLRWSWSSGPRVAACPGSSPRPATSWSGSRSRPAPSR